LPLPALAVPSFPLHRGSWPHLPHLPHRRSCCTAFPAAFAALAALAASAAAFCPIEFPGYGKVRVARWILSSKKPSQAWKSDSYGVIDWTISNERNRGETAASGSLDEIQPPGSEVPRARFPPRPSLCPAPDRATGPRPARRRLHAALPHSA